MADSTTKEQALEMTQNVTRFQHKQGNFVVDQPASFEPRLHPLHLPLARFSRGNSLIRHAADIIWSHPGDVPKDALRSCFTSRNPQVSDLPLPFRLKKPCKTPYHISKCVVPEDDGTSTIVKIIEKCTRMRLDSNNLLFVCYLGRLKLKMGSQEGSEKSEIHSPCEFGKDPNSFSINGRVQRKQRPSSDILTFLPPINHSLEFRGRQTSFHSNDIDSDNNRMKHWSRVRYSRLLLSEGDMHEYVFYVNVGKDVASIMNALMQHFACIGS